MSYTPPEMDIGVKEIRDWHVNGNGWKREGYHFVIRRDGTVEEGRPIDQVGAHVAGHNTGNLGICLIGGKNGNTHDFNFTHEQMVSAYELVCQLKKRFNNPSVYGHRDFAPRGCPGFDVKSYFSNLK